MKIKRSEWSKMKWTTPTRFCSSNKYEWLSTLKYVYTISYHSKVSICLDGSFFFFSFFVCACVCVRVFIYTVDKKEMEKKKKNNSSCSNWPGVLSIYMHTQYSLLLCVDQFSLCTKKRESKRQTCITQFDI